jgi:hypothetical protein
VLARELPVGPGDVNELPDAVIQDRRRRR